MSRSPLVWCALASALVVSACSFTREGPTVQAVEQNSPANGMARVIVFREKGYPGLADSSWSVKLDGQPLADLKTGTFAYRDLPAGKHTLTDAQWDVPGDSELDFDATAGKTYIFEMRVSDEGKTLGWATLLTGGIGYLAATEMSDIKKTGGFDFTPVDEANADQQLTELHLINP
jgi:hypothetical protein